MKTTSYFGRSYKVKITPQATGAEWTLANSAWAEESLRVTFRIEQFPIATSWLADIVIYNFAPNLQQVIQAGDIVTVTAGYNAPGAGIIFSGEVFQPLWERANDIDWTLTLHCLVGLWDQVLTPSGSSSSRSGGSMGLSFQSYVSTVVPAGLAPDACVKWVAGAANIPIDYLDPSLANGPKNPRATSVTGPPMAYIAKMAGSLNSWISFKGLVIRSLAPQGDVPDLVYAPPYAENAQQQTTGGLVKYTLIGTPAQTEDGLNFRVLLDSEIQLGALAQIIAVQKKLALSPGNHLFIDPAGIYIVAGITHYGDTRGNDWYTELHGVTRALAKLNAVMAR